MKFANTILRLYSKIPLGLPSLVVILMIAYLTLVPKPFGDEELPLFPGADKVAHFLMFGGLAGVLSLDLWHWKWGKLKPPTSTDHPHNIIVRNYPNKKYLIINCTACFLISALTGGIIELLQQWMHLGRSAEILDLVADSLGALTGSLTAYFLLLHERG